MTLDEAIKHCEEKEREQALNGCFACAEEHKQLAKWLKELKHLRSLYLTYCDSCEKAMECETPEQLIELAKTEGIELTKEQAEAYLSQLQDGEL